MHDPVEIARKRLDESHHILIGSQAMLQAALEHAKLRARTEVGVSGKSAYLLEH